jgi:hypothetical protein
MAGRITSAKLIALGTLIAFAAAATGVAIAQSNATGSRFTHLAGVWIAAAVFVLGVVIVLIGVMMRDPPGAARMVQGAGDNSTQDQSAGDLTVEVEEPDSSR